MAKRTSEDILAAGARAVAAHGPGFTLHQLQKLTGVKPGSVHYAFGTADKFRKALGVSVQDVDTKAEVRLVAERERTKANAARGALKRAMTQLEAERDQALAQVEAILALQGRVVERGAEGIVAKAKKGRLPEAAYFSLASDWHVGERVRGAEVGWRNEYNPTVCADRARQFWLSNLTMLNAARSAWDIDTYVLWLGGDFITGFIHEEYLPENFLTPIEEVLFAFDLIRDGIQTLLDSSDCARIVIRTSNGNHGRTTRKPVKAGASRQSYEFLLYKFLERHFAHESRVDFRVSEGYHEVLDVFGFRVRFSHGDAIKFGGGVGGVTVPFYRRLGRQAQAPGEQVSLDCMGHFHQLQYPRAAVFNGSLIGWNAYAEAGSFEFEKPMQASFVIDAKHHVVSNANPILVEKARK